MKILIADDCALVRHRLRKSLEKIKGVETIVEADDSCTTVSGILRQAPDVVILDLRMPGVSGMQVLETIHACRCNPVVIVLSGHCSAEYYRSCEAHGVRHFFDKYREFEKVSECVADLVRQRSDALGEVTQQQDGDKS